MAVRSNSKEAFDLGLQFHQDSMKQLAREQRQVKMATPDTTEAVAKALYRSHMHHDKDMPWERAPLSVQSLWIEHAKCAVQACYKVMAEVVPAVEVHPANRLDERAVGFVRGFNEARRLFLGDETL